MKTQKLISFDLQGTVSTSDFSDEFWLDLLPNLYAEKNNLSVAAAKEKLEQEYQHTGRYHELFYDHRLRLDSLLPKWEFKDIVDRLKTKPAVESHMIELIKGIPSEIPLVIISATTRDFIDYELGEHHKHFIKIYSAIDDFKTPGKPPIVFEKVAEEFKVTPDNCFHIGDCLEMDFQNSKKAGWQAYHLNKKQAKEHTFTELKNLLQNFIA